MVKLDIIGQTILINEVNEGKSSLLEGKKGIITCPFDNEKFHIMDLKLKCCSEKNNFITKCKYFRGIIYNLYLPMAISCSYKKEKD